MKTPRVKAGMPSRICHRSAEHKLRETQKTEAGEGGRKNRAEEEIDMTVSWRHKEEYRQKNTATCRHKKLSSV